MKKAKEDWTGTQREIETCLNKNNNKRAYQLVKNVTLDIQGRKSTIQDRCGKCLTQDKRFSADGHNIALNYTTMRVVVTMQSWTAVSPQKKIYNQSFLRKLRLQGKSIGVDYIPAEHVQAGGETMIDVSTEIGNRI